MEREDVARNILLCGLSHGREHVIRTFGDDLGALIFSTFAELHRRNLLVDSFVFLLIRMFHRRYPTVDEKYCLKPELCSKEILEYLQFTADYRKETRRLSEYSQGQLCAVLDDFVHILSRQFLCQPEVFEAIVGKATSGGL